MSSTYHVPIMVKEVMQLLQPGRGGVFVDGTLGAGGHTSAMISLMPQESLIFGIDRDSEAINEATRRIKEEHPTYNGFMAIRGNFFDMKNLLMGKGISGVDGILLDLGASSHQFDTPRRGFSFRFDAKLDMRMDMESPFSAYDVVNTYDESSLYRIIHEYGEERYARKIASNIVRERQNKPIETTTQLVDIIKMSMPQKALREKGHPAARTFQALRIHVNDEIAGLSNAIKSAIDILNPGGIIAVITFHSLEDRIVKAAFKQLQNPCTCDPKSPMCVCGLKPVVEILTRKPIEAGEEELEINPRARSAKLRGAIKV